MLPANRVGLPRKFIELMKKELGACTKGEADEEEAAAADAEYDANEQLSRKKAKCSHGPNDKDCSKYCWTVLHKGEYELVLFQDSRLIIMYGNVFSSTRCGLIGRGSHWSPMSHQVYAPEALTHYGRDGRSATDGNDQQHKKLNMSERRCQRAGTKGILWGLDRAMTNGHIMERYLAPASTPPHKMMTRYTKVRAPPRPHAHARTRDALS